MTDQPRRPELVERQGDADPTAAIREQYGAAAAAYRESIVHVGGPDLDALMELVAPTVADRAIDLGTGAGHTALRLAGSVRQVEAVDLVTAMLEQGRALASERGVVNVRFAEADVGALPYSDGAFDIAVTRYSLHHWPDPQAGLREAARVLRPSGRFGIVDTVAPEDPALDSWVNALELLRDPSHGRNPRTSELHRLLREVGLEPVETRLSSVRLEVELWLARSRTVAWRAAAARALLREATEHVSSAFEIDGDRSFSLPVAVLLALKPASRDG